MTTNLPDQTDPNELTTHLADQLKWHWEGHVRPRIEGLTDEEYLWEPVDACWNVRPRDPDSPVPQPGSGPYTIDFALPEPEPAPVTTIAWRIAHIVLGVFGARSHSHFGGPPVNYETFEYAGTAGAAVDQLDEHYARWLGAVSTLTLDQLWTPVGAAEPYPDAPMLDLVLHIHREAIHHGAEVALLRDLYAHR